MTNSTGVVFQSTAADFERLYQALAHDSRYGHYVRIPERICRCLDYFGVASDRLAVKQRLLSYYLFIGVVDHALDSIHLEKGAEILKWLGAALPSFDEEARQSSVKLVTEVLKCHIGMDSHPLVLMKLEELYGAVVRERWSKTMSAYVEQRKLVGSLTAELSYLLIRPLLKDEHQELRGFLQRVGEVGCLIDSAIDLRADERAGLLSFRLTPKAYLELTGEMLRQGSRLLRKHPRLLGLFLEAVSDDLLDRLRARRRPRTLLNQLDHSKKAYACERAA
ncbi:MAG TPA: hypothetical protein VGB17_15325 [Pyrinomonadaceae bacterium]|jgi:hypothetical protein